MFFFLFLIMFVLMVRFVFIFTFRFMCMIKFVYVVRYICSLVSNHGLVYQAALSVYFKMFIRQGIPQYIPMEYSRFQ